MIKNFYVNNILKIGIMSMVPIFSVSDLVAADVITFQGNRLSAMAINAEKNTGLDNIYVLYDTNGVSLSYKSNSDNVRWMKFSNLGGGFGEEISNVSFDGEKYTLNAIDGDMGYIIYDGDKTYAFWIVDYSKHIFSIDNIILPYGQECDMVELEFQGNTSPIYYYTINGRQETLDREISIEYTTLSWDDSSKQFKQTEITKSAAYISGSVSLIPPPYCNTYFTISGDRFLKYWNMYITKESDLYVTNSVDVQTTAEQSSETTEDSSNRIDTDVDGLGGSAPCEISFSAFVTDAVIHNEWQMSTDSEFENISYRITEQDFTYTFTEEGITYVRFVGSNSDGSCEAYGDVYTVTIGASELLVPNAFSPNDDGVNDVWKVSYRSLIDFECWIFDKQGHQLHHFSNPNDGWDGKRNGKTVKPGVYFYVIQAKGADGKKYKKSGDINIVTFKGGNSTSSSEN